MQIDVQKEMVHKQEVVLCGSLNQVEERLLHQWYGK